MANEHEGGVSMTGRTALEELSDLLDDLPMTGIQRHWADEYLRDLRAGEFSKQAREELEELRDEVKELQWRLDRAASALGY